MFLPTTVFQHADARWSSDHDLATDLARASGDLPGGKRR
jgi:hypothetical protein